MACSKLFSGDLPELINEIIQYFHYDYKTLHSCILVNRLWCRLTIPLLWEDPFSIKFPKNYYFINIYLNNLSDDDKTKLNEYGINDDLFSSNTTLFNYPSFIQSLDTRKLSSSIRNWVGNSTTRKQNPINSMQNTNLSPSQTSDFTKLIYKSLFLVLIKSEVNLNSFKVTMITDKDYEKFADIFELILQKPNFINNIKNLSIDIDIITDNITEFLMFIYSNCYSISSFYFLYPYEYNHIITEKSLSQIIDSQRNLKKIIIGFNKYPLYHSLLSLKNPNCLNTLNTIIFYYIDFKDIVVLNEVFNQLNVLESIHIVYCYSLDSKFIQQIINITKPFKLKSLLLEDIESLEPLIQKFGVYLENFEVTNNKSQQLLQSLKSIIKYCNNIKFLSLNFEPNYQIINLTFNLIENFKQNLNYLSIDVYFNLNNIDIISSVVLQNLGQILPFKLEYLNLVLAINGNDLEIFLKNSQNTFIKKFLIKNKNKQKNKGIFPYIKEYIIKKRRTKYLAILETFRETNEDLFTLKDKVKECELYDIQVLNYNDLRINTEYFLKEIF
ncbi:hypothetical protein RhiirA1_462670 [Rhizophagus irregularis]|uniref:F-box domain-containing protein n=1 Tax=Rhizophagus irregularis TaxID=588596 RepID=A0A2N0RLR6_9GLOM|nr:hypothetical protein RhiirA1_462670 [Rhizophagus irregularis]